MGSVKEEHEHRAAAKINTEVTIIVKKKHEIGRKGCIYWEGGWLINKADWSKPGCQLEGIR